MGCNVRRVSHNRLDRAMNAETKNHKCTCQLCVQDWQFVDGAFEPAPVKGQEPVEASRREAPLRQVVPVATMRPELNRVYV